MAWPGIWLTCLILVIRGVRHTLTSLLLAAVAAVLAGARSFTAITHQATPAQLAGWIRGHWGIEALHHIRDVTYGEDASQICTGNGPQVMAILRNLGIAILKPGGYPSIAAACRYHAATPPASWPPLGISPS